MRQRLGIARSASVLEEDVVPRRITEFAKPLDQLTLVRVSRRIESRRDLTKDSDPHSVARRSGDGRAGQDYAGRERNRGKRKRPI